MPLSTGRALQRALLYGEAVAPSTWLACLAAFALLIIVVLWWGQHIYLPGQLQSLARRYGATHLDYQPPWCHAKLYGLELAVCLEHAFFGYLPWFGRTAESGTKKVPPRHRMFSAGQAVVFIRIHAGVLPTASGAVIAPLQEPVSIPEIPQWVNETLNGALPQLDQRLLPSLHVEINVHWIALGTAAGPWLGQRCGERVETLIWLACRLREQAHDEHGLLDPTPRGAIVRRDTGFELDCTHSAHGESETR